MLVPQSCLTLLWPHGLQPTRLFCPWDFPGKDTGVGCHFLLQGIFPTQGSNPGLLHWRQIPYRLSYKIQNKYKKILLYELLYNIKEGRGCQSFSHVQFFVTPWTTRLTCRQILYRVSHQGNHPLPLLGTSLNWFYETNFIWSSNQR